MCLKPLKMIEAQPLAQATQNGDTKAVKKLLKDPANQALLPLFTCVCAARCGPGVGGGGGVGAACCRAHWACVPVPPTPHHTPHTTLAHLGGGKLG